MTTTHTNQPHRKVDPDGDFSDILDMRAEGKSWRKIGSEYGVSGQRMYQLFGTDPDMVAAGNPTTVREARRKELSQKVTEYLREYGPLPRASVLKEFDITATELQKLEYPRNLILQTKKKETNRTLYTDDDIFGFLRAAASEQGTPLSALKYSRWYSAQPKGSAISLPAIYLRFGGWTNAVQAAGLTSGVTHRTYSRAWESSTALSWVAAFVEYQVEHNEPVTYIKYDEWQRNYPDAPSGTTVRKVTNLGWTAVIEASADAEPHPLP